MTNDTTKTEPTGKRAAATPEATKPVRKRAEKKASTKAATRKTAKKAGAPAVTITTLDDLFDAFLGHLPKIGKSEGTVRSYSADLAVARKQLGGDMKVEALTTRKVTTYFGSDAVTRTRSGGEKNSITVAKIRRVFRQAIEFAVASGVLDESPMPAKK